MTTKDFKIWLAKNELNQKELASILCMTERTISKYSTSGEFPVLFELALKGIENENYS